jgi:hypothetical protein
VEAEGKVLELVIFELKDGVSREQFLSTDGAATAWMSQQPGFVSHELLYDAEADRWVELAWWKTMNDAQRAAEQAMTSESCAPMFALIDIDSSLMLHAEPAIPKVHA